MSSLEISGISGISVIICTFNGSERILPTLKALSAQSCGYKFKVEVLVVDNGSNDNTAFSAQNYWSSLNSEFTLKIIQEPNPGKANALVRGYNEAKYELMLLCDDDNWLQPDYLITVAEIFSVHMDIGLLGGFGKALFDEGTKPDWFDRWQNCYVCGKHHTQNGFLADMDYTIWGAGSVIRKTMWDFLRIHGFVFYNSTLGGKAMSEDAELSMAITFTGHRLYFDDRLWFTHDLRNGRITWDKFLNQQALTGKTNAVLFIYQLAFDHPDNLKTMFNLFFTKKIVGFLLRLMKSFLKSGNRPSSIIFYNIIMELIKNRSKYKIISFKSIQWISSIKNSYPLNTSINE